MMAFNDRQNRLSAKYSLGHILVASLLACSATGCGKPVAQSQPPSAPKVTVAHPISRELTDEDDYNGWLQSSAVVEVRARVRGQIQKIHFQDGDFVKSGQLLFELDPRPFQASIAEAAAQSRAYAAQKLAAENDVTRFTELAKTGAASKQELEQAQANAQAFGAQIDAMKEKSRQSELDLEFSRITAPIAGRISRAMLSEGNIVNAGGSDPLLTTIVAENPMHVYFSVDERALQRTMRQRASLESGPAKPLRERQMPFRFGLDSDQGYPYNGLLDFADNRVNSQTGTIEVRGVVDNKQQLFVAGSRVKLRVPVSETYAAVLVPDTAVLSDQDKRYLLVLDEKNIVSRRDIAPGRLLDDGLRVILPAGSGGGKSVTIDDRIIVQGLQRARINYPVEPVEATAGPSSDSVSQR